MKIIKFTLTPLPVSRKRKYRENYLAIIDKMTKFDIVTDKAPLNFRWIGLIKLLFPNAIIIHCKRDPLENSWSIYKNDFDGGMLFSNDTKETMGILRHGHM